MITSLVPPSSKVLDLGCGDGALLLKLKTQKKAFVQGIDIDPEMIRACVGKGIPVIQDNMNTALTQFTDASFDFVILSQTLQVVKRPDEVIRQMLRVGRKAIVSLPNFGHWLTRFQLFFHGAMPVNKNLPYEWYNSPNNHFCTLKDFHRLCRENSWNILQEFYLANGKPVRTFWPNIFAAEMVSLIGSAPQ